MRVIPCGESLSTQVLYIILLETSFKILLMSTTHNNMLSMNTKCIIMNYTTAPTLDDLEAIGCFIIDSLPDALSCHCEELELVVEDMVDETLQDDLKLDDPFDLLALYKSGKSIGLGVERKIASKEDVLVIYRRSLLDMWSETGEDLQILVRQVIIEELGRYFELSEDDIQEMNDQGYQSML